MRKTLLSATLLVGFAAPTFAQNQPPGQPAGPGDNYQSQPGATSEQPSPWARMGRMMGGERGEEGMRFMGGGGGGGGRGMRRMMHVRVKEGNNEVDVRCPPDVTLQSCMGAATDLISALGRAAPSGGTHSPGQP